MLDGFGGGARALNQRIAQLRRILKSEKPDAWDVVVMPDGGTAPKYLKREMGYARRWANASRAGILGKAAPGFDAMTPVQQATVLADKNLATLPNSFSSGYDLTSLQWEKWGGDLEYFNSYIAVLEESEDWAASRGEIISIIKDLYNEPGILREIMEANFDEATIEYIYVSSADKTPFEIRKRNVIEFWREQRDAQRRRNSL